MKDFIFDVNWILGFFGVDSFVIEEWLEISEISRNTSLKNDLNDGLAMDEQETNPSIRSFKLN